MQKALHEALINAYDENILMKGYSMKKVVVGFVLALTVAACSAPTTEPVETMVTPEPTSQKL